MKIIKTTINGIIPNEYLYIKDTPKIFEGDYIYLSIHFDWNISGGHFLKPSTMFDCPEVGDLIDQKMESGKILRSVVTNYTQDYDIGKGNIHILCYKDDFNKLLKHNTL